MPKRKQPMSATALTYAEAEAIPASERIHRFVFEAGAGQRAFAGMAKLFRVMQASLAPGQAIFPLLIGAGVKKGTVSNASIAASVYDLVEGKHLSEAEFDSLTFNDCWQLKRVLSSKAKKSLPVADAVAMIRNNPDFADEFASLYETGMTTMEAAAKQPKPEPKEPAPKAEQPAAEDAKPEAEPAPETEPPAVEDAKPKAEKPAPAPEPARPTAEQLIAMLEQVELAMAELPADEQGVVGAKLIELASAFVESGKAVKPARRKKQLAA